MVLAALVRRHSSEEPSISQVFEGLTSFCIFKLNIYEPLSQIYRCIYSLLADQNKDFFNVKKLYNSMCYILGRDFVLI